MSFEKIAFANEVFYRRSEVCKGSTIWIKLMNFIGNCSMRENRVSLL